MGIVELIIYILFVIIILISSKKSKKKNMFLINLKISTAVSLLTLINYCLNYYKVINYTMLENTSGLTIEITILLATAYIFIFGFESKKIFGRSVAEYFSEELNTMLEVFFPTIIYALLTSVFDKNYLITLELHVIIYNAYSFIYILNEVLDWNKKNIKDKYVNQVIEQFYLLPTEPDEVTLSCFLTDIDSYKILEDERFDSDILFKNRVNKIIRDIDELPAIRAFEDKIAYVLFKEIINQFIYLKREHTVIETNYSYYMNTFIGKLDSYELTQLLYNKFFSIKGLDEIVVIEILLNRIVQLNKRDIHNDISLYLPSVLEFTLKNRVNVKEDDLIILFYSLLYENEIDMINCLNPKFIDSFNELKTVAIVEAIIDWNNYRFETQSEKTKYLKLKIDRKLNKCSNNQCLIECSSYIDIIRRDLSVEEIIIHITLINKLYNETIKQIEMRYMRNTWTPYKAKEIIITKVYASSLFDWIIYLYNLYQFTQEDALIYDSMIKSYYLINHIDETSELLKKRLNEIFKNKYNL